MNLVFLEGNVGTIVYDNQKEDSGACFIVSLATSEKYVDKAGNEVVNTTWHKVVSFGKIAAVLRTKVITGTRLFIKGKIQSNKFADKNGVEQRGFDVLILSYIISA